jgi:hypothetical protein
MAKPAAGGRSAPDWIWPGIAFVTIGLFLGYLWWATREPEVRIVEEGSTRGGRPIVSATLETFAAAPARFSGRIVRLDSVRVASRLGRAAFAIELPGRAEYPVVLERHLVEEDIQVTTDDRLSLIGSVYALNDSVVATWAARGVLDATNRERLRNDSTFLLADSVQVLLPTSPKGPAGS